MFREGLGLRDQDPWSILPLQEGFKQTDAAATAIF